MIYAGNENNWEFWTGNGTSWNEMTSNQAVEIGEWVHLVGTYDADTGTKNFYIDGVLAASISGLNFAANTVDPLHVGAGDDLGSSFFFQGAIDEVAIYDYVLSSLDITEHYQTGITGQFVQSQAAVPEPASVVMWLTIGIGAACCGWLRVRRRHGN